MQVDGPEMETHPLGSSTSSLAFENDTVTHVRCHQMPEYKLGIKRVNFSKCKTRLLIDLNHCEYIFLRTSSAQDSNSFSLFCLQSMVMEKEAFSKTKIKGRPGKFELRREDLNA